MPRPRPALPRRLATVLLLAGVAWAFYAQAREAAKLHHRWQHQAWEAHQPFYWRLGTPPTDRMRHFLGLADAYADAPGDIAFSSLQEGRDGLVLWLWASYFLPHRTLRPAYGPGLLEESAWWISWNTALDDHRDADRLEKVLHTDDGVLYRVVP